MASKEADKKKPTEERLARLEAQMYQVISLLADADIPGKLRLLEIRREMEEWSG